MTGQIYNALATASVGREIISDLREFAKNLLIVQFGSVKFYTDRTFNIVQFPRLWRIIGLFSSSIGIYHCKILKWSKTILKLQLVLSLQVLSHKPI
jgi:hypothetical protein